MTSTRSILARADAVTVRDRSLERPAPPAVFASARGAWCTDLEGNRYIDLTASSGAVLLGHGNQAVAEKVIEAVRDGAVGLADAVTTPLVEVAERLVARYPAAERVAFFRTGSEATTAAVRLTRAATGRRWVLSAGYHGWHDWHLGIRGLGANTGHGIIHFGYRVDALASLLDALAGEVASVIVSPEPAWISAEALVEMGKACKGAGVPFILDEVMTGLRFGPAGVNGSGVDADVIVLAKGLANGHSIAAVAGGDDIVGAYHEASIGGTYNREVAPLAAARVVLDATESGDLHRRAGAAGTAMREGVTAALRCAGIPVWAGGPPMMFDLVMADDSCASMFFTAMFARGVHMDRTGTQFVTGAHSQQEVEVVAAAAEDAASLIAAELSDPPAMDDARLHAFALDAFGAVLAADADWQADVERVLDEMGRNWR